ncbi:hypothetical protein ALC62_15112 [Cyphomyrmex costatus]|uniref:Uncharacterized protein n=1 Tax=Cyphomyrmex costatus TaxID=456900 RepID=A0A151I7Z0_9HYME|nr:hypothetical protein ALC62_15112 [Cyphomyrmex costatus]
MAAYNNGERVSEKAEGERDVRTDGWSKERERERELAVRKGEGQREREREKKESASRHIATEDEKGDSRGRKTLGNSEEWDGGVGGMGNGGGGRRERNVVGTVQGRGVGGEGGTRRHSG